jgi:hypothetical protein
MFEKIIAIITNNAGPTRNGASYYQYPDMFWKTAKMVVETLFFFILYVGWIINIIKLGMSIQDPITTVMVIRIIGLPFVLIGGVIGYV